MTLRARLTAAATLTVAVAMLIVSLGVYFLVAQAVQRDIAGVLRAQAQREARALRTSGRLASLQGTEVALLRASGQIVLGRWTKGLPQPPRSTKAANRLRRFGSDGWSLLHRLPDGLWLALARHDAQGAVMLVRLRRYLWILAALAMLVAAALSYFIADEMLSPLRRVVRTATAIARHGDTGRRLGQIGAGEMRALAQAFDAMLDRLAHALQQQRQAIEGERRFAAEAAHVLRNPLATVLLNLEYLQRGLPQGSEFGRAAQDAYGEAQRLLHLTESLLRLARGESVGESAQIVDLGEVAAEAAKVTAQGRHRPLPELQIAQGALVRGDRAALFGLVESILDNAYKYSPESAPVALRVYPDRGLVRLAVEDRGRGIAPEDLPHVFDRFYRAERSVDGHGLGLAIARAVAQAHGGQIRVDSELGAGTRVEVEIPASR